MALRRVQVTDFRCLRTADFELDPGFTLISGPNASGKTSLLEAIYLLGRGRSFRTRRIDHLIRSGTGQFVIFGDVDAGGRRIALGVEGSAGGIRGKLGGQRVSTLADLAAAFPVQIIDPEVHRLIEEGPSRRRRFMDWGVFHVEHSFVGLWQQYQQVLRQRNAALKSRQSASAIVAWDHELVRLGELVHGSRQRYFTEFSPMAISITRSLLGHELSLGYRSGWSKDQSLAEALKGSWNLDQESGSTQVGPQRADISIRLNGAPVKDRVSRGQQKLLAAALLMAQLYLFPAADGWARPTLLLDDPAAELDAARLIGLIEEIHTKAMQLVVTSLSADFRAFGAPGRRYDISDGVLTRAP